MAAKIVIDPEPLVFVETKVVEEPEPELKFVEDPKPETKIVAGLVSLQEEISSQFTEVVELPIETLVDLPAKPTTELVPSLTVMRASLFLRSPDMYDPLQIFFQEAVLQEIGTLI